MGDMFSTDAKYSPSLVSGNILFAGGGLFVVEEFWGHNIFFGLST